jgi:hypothetical protein
VGELRAVMNIPVLSTGEFLRQLSRDSLLKEELALLGGFESTKLS